MTIFRAKIAVCILLLFIIFQSQVSVDAQQVLKVITVENAKQLRLVNLVKVTDFAASIENQTVAARKNIMAFYAASTENNYLKHHVYLFDLASYNVINQFEATEIYNSFISVLKLDKEGNYLAIAVHRPGPAFLWKIDTATKLYDIQTTPATDFFTQFDFSADGTMFVAANEYIDSENKRLGVVEIREVQTGDVINVLQGGHTTYATVAISENMRYVAAATGFGPFFEGAAIIDVWDLKTGQLIRTLKGHTDGIFKLLFSPDAKYLISASGYSDKSIRIWNLDTGKVTNVIYMERPLQDITLSPDGTVLASTGEDGAIHVWDLAATEELIVLKDETILTPDDAHKNVDFSLDGTRIILSEDGRSLEFWGVQ